MPLEALWKFKPKASKKRLSIRLRRGDSARPTHWVTAGISHREQFRKSDGELIAAPLALKFRLPQKAEQTKSGARMKRKNIKKTIRKRKKIKARQSEKVSRH